MIITLWLSVTSLLEGIVTDNEGGEQGEGGTDSSVLVKDA